MCIAIATCYTNDIGSYNLSLNFMQNIYGNLSVFPPTISIDNTSFSNYYNINCMQVVEASGGLLCTSG